MSSCPRCKKIVGDQAIICPNCDMPLKAFGHPGIPLYQSTDGTSLCDRCTYDQDDTCNFPRRPHAKSCTLFHDYEQPLVQETFIPPSQRGWSGFKYWLLRYRSVILIALIIFVSIAIALNV